VTQSPSVELVYFSGCDYVEQAREALRAAFAKLGRDPQWQEWDQDAPGAPDSIQRHGSPTILIGGKDVTGPHPDTHGRACRADDIPSPEAIAEAILQG
jgi:hypothetical protein